MNLSEYELLSKEDIFKMYENVCEELEQYESVSQDSCDSCDEFCYEIHNLEKENNTLREEITTLKEELDNHVPKGMC